MAEVRFSQRALIRLREIESWLSERNPAASDRVLHEIRDLCGLIGAYPEMGRAIVSTGLRFHVSRRYQYRIIYRISDEFVEIRDILHPRQQP